MAIVRRSVTDNELREALDAMARSPMPTDAEIEQHALEDDSVTVDQTLRRATVVLPLLEPERIRALRARLGLSQEKFARRYGFSPDAIEQYEQGRRAPRGVASNLLRVIEADPDLVARVLDPRAFAAREAEAAK